MNLPFRMYMLSVALSLVCAAEAQTVTGTLLHNGLLRSYRLYVPPGYSPAAPAPLVMQFHGYTSTALAQQLYSRFDAVADTAGCLVVYPQGVNNAWNSGFFGQAGVDDVGFVRALASHLALSYTIDRSRVYAAGMSNGGFMAHYLACEAPDLIAAAASVTGGMTWGTLSSCDPERPVPVMEVHGTADGVVPYAGNLVFAHTDSTIGYWAARHGCTQPDTAWLPDLVQEGSMVQQIRWSTCSSGGEVRLYRVLNGGHAWPGALPVPGENTNQDLDASAEMWRFFRRFQLPGAAGAEPAAELPVLVYPNPFASKLYLRNLSSSPVQWRCSTLEGRLLASGQLNPGETQVMDADAWPAGACLWQAAGETGTVRRLLIRAAAR